MRIGSLVGIALVLSTCGCAASLDELMLEANRTGDWTAVERRMAANERRAQRRAARTNHCADGQVAVIVHSSESHCTDAREIARVLQESRGPFY